MSSTSNTPGRIDPHSSAPVPSDTEIATFLRFLFKSTTQHGLPLEHPCRSVVDDTTATSSSVNSPLGGVAGFKRSCTVLDALVSVCIHASKQCLALSVTFGPKIRICIAQNSQKPQPRVKAHLESIWTQLKGLAAVQKRLRHENGLLDAIVEGISPKGAETLLSGGSRDHQSLKQLKQTLNRDVHRFCYFKTKSRVKKYLSGIPTFYDYYLDNQPALDISKVLRKVIYFLFKINEIVVGNKEQSDITGIPNLNWDELVGLFNLLLRQYTNNMTELIERSRFVMATWNGLPMVKEDHTLRQFDLARALQKMVTLSSHTQDLINFAYSPRLRSTLEKDLEVVLVDPIVVSMPEPSLDDMKVIVKRAFDTTEYARDHHALGVTEKVALQATLDKQLDLVQATLSTAVPSISVHAEYTLLIYHHREAEEQHLNVAFMPPFQYIAVNKLSCFCCWNIYKEYSRTTNRIFSLRGSHSKLYFPWWAATNYFEHKVAMALRRGLYSRLVDLYSEHMKQLEDSHNRLSDSTVASNESGADDRITADETDEREAEEKMEMDIAERQAQKRGG